MKPLLFGIGCGIGFFGGCLAFVAAFDVIFRDDDSDLVRLARERADETPIPVEW